VRILLIEDDALLGDGVKAGLEQAGFSVDWVQDGVAGEPAPRLRLSRVELDPAARLATYEGKALDLSAREFALLHELMLNAGRVLSREQLSERLYAWGEEIESNAIDVHIHHLRRKLAPALIRTVRGVGYVMPRDPDA
jgi:DNA-binding response OmpR family regulator